MAQQVDHFPRQGSPLGRLNGFSLLIRVKYQELNACEIAFENMIYHLGKAARQHDGIKE
ncbi:MAG: hypothetical protein JO108_18430 [Acidobacteriaceae bacterium]|nr:hypothetical protein [Acidobacteriaceae bacterium]